MAEFARLAHVTCLRPNVEDVIVGVRVTDMLIVMSANATMGAVIITVMKPTQEMTVHAIQDTNSVESHVLVGNFAKA